MEYKTLNTVDALRVAQIITKYIKIDTVSEITGYDFIYTLLAEVSEEELLYVTDVLLYDNLDDFDEFTDAIMKALIENSIMNLLKFYSETFGEKK